MQKMLNELTLESENIINSLEKLDGKHQYVEVYHELMKLARAYSRHTSNVPKQNMVVIQQTYGLIIETINEVYIASNSFKKTEKMDHIDKAVLNANFIYSYIQFLVEITDKFSIGQANEVINLLNGCYNQLTKWQTSVINS